MQKKLQELTDKIYKEGVEKAKGEAERIIAKANQEAENIIKEARQKASNIESEANSKAEDTKRNVEAEIKLATTQAMSAIRQKIADLINLKVLDPSVKEVFGDKKFMQGLIEKVVKGWIETGQLNMNLLLPADDKIEMEAFFKNSLAAELNKGLSIEFGEGVQSGFKVAPEDKSYLVSFSDDDFINFFKTYLRPRTIQLLFDQE